MARKEETTVDMHTYTIYRTRCIKDQKDLCSAWSSLIIAFEALLRVGSPSGSYLIFIPHLLELQD